MNSDLFAIILILGYLPVFFIGGHVKYPNIERDVIIRCKEDPKWCDAKYFVIKSEMTKRL